MAIPARIERFLKENGCTFSVLHHPAAYTAQEEAAVTHVPGREWAKTVVYFADETPILAVLPADRIVDEERLRAVTGARIVRLAEEREFAPLYPDCERGAMPPLGPLYGQTVVVDESLAADPEIVFNGGTHSDAIRMPYRDFERAVRPRVASFGRKDLAGASSQPGS